MLTTDHLGLDDPRLLRALYPWESAAGAAPDAQRSADYRRESGLDDDLLARRAAAAGLSAQVFIERLQAGAVSAAPPWWNWLQQVDQAMAAEGEQLYADISHDLRTAQWALIGHCHAELGLFARQLHTALSQVFSAELALHLQKILSPLLVRQYWALAHPSVLLELRLAKQKSELHGADPAARFADFARQLRGERRPALKLLYPMLWRDLATRALQWLEWFPQLLGEIHEHRTELRHHYGFDTELTQLQRIDASVADPHQHGRCTLILHFTGGRLVYKPRDLRAEERGLEVYGSLCAALGWSPPLPRMLHTQHGGFMAFVASEELPDLPDAAARYYYFCGVLLAFGHALLANDLHYENIIALGDGPVPIDLETLLQPLHDGVDAGLPSDLLRLSLLRVGLLPRASKGDPAESSALLPRAGEPYPASDFVDEGLDSMRLHALERVRSGVDRHLPQQGGRAVLVQGFEAQLEQGLCDGLRELRQRTADPQFSALLQSLRGATVRRIARATQQYQMLLDATLTPRYLQSAARRLALLDKLWTGLLPTPADAPRIQAEILALLRRDVPYFHGASDGRELGNSEMQALPWAAVSAWDSAQQEWSSLDDPARLRQHRQTLRFAFATQPSAADHRIRHLPGALDSLPVRAPDWLRLARCLGDHMASLVCIDAHQVNWLQLEGTAHGMRVQHAGLGLYNGIAGIALALARLAVSTAGTAADRDLVQRLLSSIEYRLARNPRALTSLGYAGAGGLLYAAAGLQQLGFASLSPTSLQRVYDYVDAQLPQLPEQDVISGSAGVLLGLCALARCGERASSQRIEACVQRIQDLAQPQTRASGSMAWPSSHYPLALTGAAHGAAGIALALHEAAQFCDSASRSQSQQLIEAALRYEECDLDRHSGRWRDARFGVVADAAEYCMAWCHGAPGLTHARLRLWPAARRAELTPLLAGVMAHGFGEDWVICHGDFGQLLLLQAAVRGGVLDHRELDTCAARVHQGWLQAWPQLSRQALSMGLFDGLAGVLWTALDLAQMHPTVDLLGLECSWRRADG